jgi:hypothetical protein
MNGWVGRLACLSGQGYIMRWTGHDRTDTILSLFLITMASLFLILLRMMNGEAFTDELVLVGSSEKMTTNLMTSF